MSCATLALSQRFNPLQQSVELDTSKVFGPDQLWEAAPIATQYADEAVAVIDLVEELLDDPVPFWSPVLFDGYGTLLDDVHAMQGVFRLLVAEFRVAVYRADHDRALRALRLMLGLADAFDTDIAFVAKLVRFAILNEHRSLIQQSLAVGFWDQPEHLSQLRDQLQQPGNLDEHWKRSVDAESAMLASELLGDTAVGHDLASLMGGTVNPLPFGMLKSTSLELFRQLAAPRNITGAGSNQHVQKVLSLDEQSNASRSRSMANSVVGIPLANFEILVDLVRPAYSQLALAFSRFEFETKITLLAVAIKQYQIQLNHWPAKLSDLSAVGLSADQWQIEPSVAIGYKTDDGGQAAILWAAVGNDSQIFVPPLPATEKTPHQQRIWNLTIR